MATDISSNLERAVNEDGYAYAARYPPKPNRGAAVLLISQNRETAERVARLLFREGYAVKPVPTLQEASVNVRNSYLEAIVLDVEGVVPPPEDYAESDAVVFLKGVKNTRDLPVLLISSGKTYPQPPPAILDLTNIGAISNTGMPFEATALGGGFFEILRTAVEDVKAKQKNMFVVVNEELPTREAKGESPPLPLRVGEAVKAIYERDRHGGAGHYLRDSISGVAVRIKPTEAYPENASAIHIKRVTPEEALRFRETFWFLKSKSPERRIPTPLGIYSEGETAYSVLTFLIASNFADIRTALNPSNPQLRESDREIAAKLWDETLSHFFGVEFPEWYSDTHERVMEEDNRAVREATLQRQVDQVLLLPKHIADISGERAPQGLYERMAAAVLSLNNKLGGIDPRLFVLPMDPKGVNMGHMTYQSIPTPQKLLELFTKETPQGRYVNTERLGLTFASWGHGMLGTVNPLLVDLWQTLLDPNLNIPEQERPLRMAQSLGAIFQGTDLNEFLIEIWRQGLYKAALKAFVSVAHAQVNEGRLARMKTLDYDATAITRRTLQGHVDYFLAQTLKFASGLYRAISEEHAKLKWPQPLERMIEHFKDPERSVRLENGTASKKPELVALRTMHEGFSLIARESLGRFDPLLLRESYVMGRMLRYQP